MLRDTYLKLVALSHDEDVPETLRQDIRREIDKPVQLMPGSPDRDVIGYRRKIGETAAT